VGNGNCAAVREANHKWETGQPEPIAEHAGHRRHGHGAAIASAATPPQQTSAENEPSQTKAEAALRRPNVVIILGDDMGFSDMGAFGSEIKTPNLDSLARDGVRFTNFYTHASSSPTRSMLLSGVDTHLNGMGNMDEWTAPNQRGLDGYEGYLNNRVVTLPQMLKEAGYHTYMVASGIWVRHRIRSRPRVDSSVISRCSTGRGATGT